MSQAIDLRINSSTEGLQYAWRELQEQKPAVRTRDAAVLFGVSEAQLTASGCGDTATRLTGDWARLIEALPDLGPVMALTRNDHAVHEKIGQYRHIRIIGNIGLVLGEQIDLRLFLNHWHYAFAVSEDTRSGLRHSLHFFDSDGSAVHKIYLTEHSDRRAYDALVAAWRSSDQSPQQPVLGRLPVASPHPDHSIDVEGFRAHWRALRDTHDFHYLLKAFGVTRTQGLRLGGTEFARPVATDAAPTLLHAIAEQSLNLMVFVSNPGVVQIHTGPVKNLKATEAWFNVLDDDFNLHLRQEDVASAWVVTKPTVDGPVTSLELYDSAGNAIAWLFGKRKPGQPENPAWRALAMTLPTLEPTS